MKRIFAGAAAALAAVAASSAAADFSPAAPVRTEHANSEMLVAREGFAPGETTWFAFSQKLQPGWHVYWRNPGDSGLPLEFNWTLPEGFTPGEPVYPTPERIPIGPLANYGHHDDPVFLAGVTAPADARLGDEVVVKVTASWLICEEICVPEEGSFELTMPIVASPRENSKGAAAIAKARSQTPAAYKGEAVFTPGVEKMRLRVDWTDRARPREVYFFPVPEGIVEPSEEQSFSLKGGVLTVTMAAGYAPDFSDLQSVEGVLRTSGPDGAQGFEINAALEEGAATTAPATGFGGLPLLLAMAFLGGVLLNVMPCVFPILFIKAASMVKSAHGDRAAMRRHGLIYAAGVVATFAALGGALLLLRAGGEQIGWGFHLQSPVVVGLSAYVLFLVGLNLAGLYSVGENLQGVGDSLTTRGGDAGAFFTGMLTVFVAAPCIGPLLSAPMGAAVLLPPATGMLIFILMALGLAAPYLTVSFAPALGRKLPKPGCWMNIFKQTLSFPVFAAAAYFLWVLTRQTGADGLGKILFGAVFLALAAWLFEKSKGDGSRAFLVRIGAAVAALLALAPLSQLKLAENAGSESDYHFGALDAQAYDAAALATLRGEGRPVFVDFTAAWCVTCQFDRITVLSKQAVADAFKEAGVTFMVADWTSRDPEITKALSAFNATGVPLYVYYPAGGGAPRILTPPLTVGAVVSAVKD
ncbi:MAG: protein-disulfide reductase DsbD family protein [Parvularculaceae bacterium]